MLNSHYVMFIYTIHDTYFRLVAQNLIKQYLSLVCHGPLVKFLNFAELLHEPRFAQVEHA